jgi:hypothetical protein
MIRIYVLLALMGYSWTVAAALQSRIVKLATKRGWLATAHVLNFIAFLLLSRH